MIDADSDPPPSDDLRPDAPEPLPYRSPRDDRPPPAEGRHGWNIAAGAASTVGLLAASVVLMVRSFDGQPASGSPDVSGVLYPLGTVAGVVAVAVALLVAGGPPKRAFAAGLLVGLPVSLGLVVLLVGACFVVLR